MQNNVYSLQTFILKNVVISPPKKNVIYVNMFIMLFLKNWNI